jgi:hypothetical protein
MAILSGLMADTGLPMTGVIRLAIAKLAGSEGEPGAMWVKADNDAHEDTHAIRRLAAKHQLLQTWPIEEFKETGVTVQELLHFAFKTSSPGLDRLRSAIRGVTLSRDEVPSPSSIGGALRELFSQPDLYDGFRLTKHRTRTGNMRWKVKRI